jgi:hypothetical protein
MLNHIPNLKFFSNAYWNQMGNDVYGNIDAAFRQFVADAARLPDGGRDVRRALLGEIMLITDNDAYGRWVNGNRTNPETIKTVGGRFIMPDQVKLLMAILDEKTGADT